MVQITEVAPDGIGAELELDAGDFILAINGHPVRDLVDFSLLSQDEELLIEVRKASDEIWDLHVEKDPGEDLGLEIEHPEPTQCGNNCIFCFVHQLPGGMRRTLYVKDEDYRFSYLYGAYVTLTNIEESEIERIIAQHLSPLYVSVHATDDQLRERMLGARLPSIMALLRRLVEAGIELHTQIVLCPGVNDGAQLEKSVEDLYALYPGVASLAVVPVGLTGYRERLPQLRTPTAEEARAVLDVIGDYQERFLAAGQSRFVFAADELYLRAGRDFPPLADYEELPQIENGVGLIPLFREEAEEALEEAENLAGGSVSLITGESSYPELAGYAARLAERTGIELLLYPVKNSWFGGQVSVTGLLTGKDILEQLRGCPLGEALLIPDVVLKEGEQLLLDDMSLVDLERDLGIPVHPVASSPWGLLEKLEELFD